MRIFSHFEDLQLTPSQEEALSKLERFFQGPNPVFMLKGYAGSGKTTILKGLVKYLSAISKDFALLAPTGRAAKVIREKTGQEAVTIHKGIYCFDELLEVNEGDSFFYSYALRNSIDVAGKVFIVDEASMVSNAKSEGEFFRFGSGFLLNDLIQYTRVKEPNVHSKIIFVGDPCQLAPVGDTSSKAFEADYFREKFELTCQEAELKEVLRQDGESGILLAATKIRKSISAGYFNDFNLKANNRDVFNLPGDDFLTTWEGVNSTKIIIASKNKTCLDINLRIRERKFGRRMLPPQKGEIVIIGANNYRTGVFNGEFAVVNSSDETIIQRTIYLKGKKPVNLVWRDVELVFPDGENSNKLVKGKMLENFLFGDNYLTPEETQALYVDFTQRHPGLKSQTPEFKDAIMKDEYFNCLRLKYGYAVTCHKAQGGEWDQVFSIWDHENADNFNYLTDKQRKAGKTNKNFYRWAYTAVTRSSKKHFALNPPFFNSYSTLSFLEMPVIKGLEELSGKSLQPEDITVDAGILEALNEMGLANQPVALQDHFIRVRHAVRKRYVEIVAWEKKAYEIWYTFQREQEKASLKTWINGKNEFKTHFAIVPAVSPYSAFNSEIAGILQELPILTIQRNSPETILSRIAFEVEHEEKFPFTRYLFDDLESLFTTNEIRIEAVEHHLYRERYTLVKGSQTAVIDFEYNQHGFFGRVLPMTKQSNSPALLAEVQLAIQTLKQEEHAC